MTPAQQMEVKRMTEKMWEVLENTNSPSNAQPLNGHAYVRVANILARRGFVEVSRDNGRHTVQATEAGREALEMRAARHSKRSTSR